MAVAKVIGFAVVLFEIKHFALNLKHKINVGKPMEIDNQQNDESQVRFLYKRLLESWNGHNANDFANLFTPDAIVIGFDGSGMNGRKEVNDVLGKIFADHKISSYVYIVRDFRVLSATIFMLNAVAGMVPPGQSTIIPGVNAIQTLIARKEEDDLSIILFQNTPAAFHGRPEVSEQLTRELQAIANTQKTN